VYTDDIVEASKEVMVKLAQDYRFAGFDLNELTWKRGRGEVVFKRDELTVYRYSAQAQAGICGELRAARATARRIRD
jgi:hypothetical protein